MSFKVTFTVSTQAEARELDAAWHEIVTGKRFPHMEVLEETVDAIMERPGRAPGALPRRRLQRERLSLRPHRPRALDTELANACLDYLNYDRLGKREGHHQSLSFRQST